jgi:molybdopterin-binding protein
MIEVRNISYAIDRFALKNISFSIEAGDYFAIIGPSGAGKTVIIELLAGIITPQSGQLFSKGGDITHLEIQKRSFPVVFQDYALFPHLTAFKNIEFGLKEHQKSATERKKIIQQLALELNIEPLLHRYPKTLSGGEQQRVAIARALACNPQLLIFDEPLASIDESAKDELIKLLRKINAQGTTIVHITHHYEEALLLSNKIAVVHQGELIQWGATEDVLCNPKHPFVARFIGYKNIFKASFVSNEVTHARISNTSIDFLITEKIQGEGYIYLSENDIILSLAPLDSSAINHFSGMVTNIYLQSEKAGVNIDIGVDLHCVVSLPSAKQLGLSIGSPIYVSFKATAVKIIH